MDDLFWNACTLIGVVALVIAVGYGLFYAFVLSVALLLRKKSQINCRRCKHKGPLTSWTAVQVYDLWHHALSCEKARGPEWSKDSWLQAVGVFFRLAWKRFVDPDMGNIHKIPLPWRKRRGQKPAEWLVCAAPRCPHGWMGLRSEATCSQCGRGPYCGDGCLLAGNHEPCSDSPGSGRQ